MTAASDKIRPAKVKVRSLPLGLWPEADRNAWNAACRPAARLKRGGVAGHLKPVTRDDLARPTAASWIFSTGVACSDQTNRLRRM